MDTLTHPVTVAPVDPRDRLVQALLAAHHALMRASSPVESCHVLAPEHMVGSDVHLFGAQSGETLVGIGGYRLLVADHAELKSMHTSARARGSGVGRALLRALLDAARSAGARQVSLETGTAPVFAAAHALYLNHGFVECPPFGDYRPDPESRFLTRAL